MKLTISNSLIIISLIFTLVSLQKPDLMIYWMNNIFLLEWKYINFVIQLCFYSFLHWGLLHLIFNSLFLYIFWNKIENEIWAKSFLIFFILTTLFNSFFILNFSNGNTVWISWFWMALLSFYTMSLYKIKNQDYKWWITAIIINIAMWFWTNISLIWHLFWAVFWYIYYIIYNKFFTK